MRPPALRVVTLVAASALAAACGGSSSPTSPSGGKGGGSGGSGDAATTITISASGVVSPKTLTVPAGTRVTFVNNDSRVHDIASNPHPEHTDCIEINQVGFLQAGQSRQTGNLTTVRSCGFHDHQQPTNTNLQGTIVIQ
jgi:plastocyanin